MFNLSSIGLTDNPSINSGIFFFSFCYFVQKGDMKMNTIFHLFKKLQHSCKIF